jgi:hypothetical protein
VVAVLLGAQHRKDRDQRDARRLKTSISPQRGGTRPIDARCAFRVQFGTPTRRMQIMNRNIIRPSANAVFGFEKRGIAQSRQAA